MNNVVKDFFDLTIGPDYVPLWAIWEAVREFVQNALDGVEDGFPFDIHRGSKGTVVIRNKGAVLKPEHLILGKTTKFNTEKVYRGQYGEGFKLGMMALCRIAKAKGQEVALIIHTGDETWVPTIHFSPKYNTEIIRVNTYARNDDGYLSVEIPDVSMSEWLKIQDKILCLGLQKKAEVPGIGELLLDEKYKGALYCKGLWVSDLPSPSKFGYNLTTVGLDRDRKMADNYSLKTSITRLISKLVLKDELSCEQVLEFLGDSKCIEEDALRFYPDYSTTYREFKEKVSTFWKKLHGDKAIPVTSPHELQLGASLGQNCVAVNGATKDFLGDFVLQLSAVKAEKEHEIVKVYDNENLDDRERYIVHKALVLAKEAMPTQARYSIQIVDFAMPNLNGLCRFETGLISIARKQACDYIAFVGTLIHELAHLPGWLDQSKEHMDEATHIAARMLYIANKDVT